MSFFSIAKAILTFFKFWDADYIFVLIFVVESKVCSCVFIYIIYLYNAFKKS